MNLSREPVLKISDIVARCLERVPQAVLSVGVILELLGSRFWCSYLQRFSNFPKALQQRALFTPGSVAVCKRKEIRNEFHGTMVSVWLMALKVDKRW